MMYVVFIIDYIHHLMNESKMLIFAYNGDWRTIGIVIKYVLLCYFESKLANGLSF